MTVGSGKYPRTTFLYFLHYPNNIYEFFNSISRLKKFQDPFLVPVNSIGTSASKSHMPAVTGHLKIEVSASPCFNNGKTIRMQERIILCVDEEGLYTYTGYELL